MDQIYIFLCLINFLAAIGGIAMIWISAVNLGHEHTYIMSDLWISIVLGGLVVISGIFGAWASLYRCCFRILMVLLLFTIFALFGGWCSLFVLIYRDTGNIKNSELYSFFQIIFTTLEFLINVRFSIFILSIFFINQLLYKL